MLTLANVALRSLFLESSWNHQGQQNLGLAAAIDPALKKIYPAGEELKKARERSLGFFNTNPIVSGPAIGVLIKLEQDVAAGRLSPENRDRLIAGINRPLAAMGDSFFWQSWLPLCCLSAVWAVIALKEPWTPFLLPVLFCLPALPVRFFGLYLGYRRGLDIIDLFDKFKVQILAQNARRLLALIVGASTVILFSTQTTLTADGSLSRLWLTMGGVVASVLVFRFLSRKTRGLEYWYPAIMVILACFLLLFLNRS